MKQELETKLKEKYPQLLEKVAYFECDNGWYDVIDQMCYLVDDDAKVQRRLNAEFESPYFVQIKEKFGVMRAYAYDSNDYARGVIAMSEAMTRRTCEACGSIGKERNNRWIRVLCDPCQNDLIMRRQDNEKER